MQVVINRRYGGYGLSHEAIMALAELKGFKLFPIKGEYSTMQYWKKEHTPLTHKEFMKLSETEREAYLKMKKEFKFEPMYVPRHDKDLVKIVRTMGEAANGPFAHLVIVDAHKNYDIDEYDGMEKIINHFKGSQHDNFN